MVAPSGTAKAAYSRGTPRFFSVMRSVSGSVPMDDRDTNASWMAGQALWKYRIGLSPLADSSTG